MPKSKQVVRQKLGPDFDALILELGSSAPDALKKADARRCVQRSHLLLAEEEELPMLMGALRDVGICADEPSGLLITRGQRVAEGTWQTYPTEERVAWLAGSTSTIPLAFAYQCTSCGWVRAADGEWNPHNGLYVSVCRICRQHLGLRSLDPRGYE